MKASVADERLDAAFVAVAPTRPGAFAANVQGRVLITSVGHETVKRAVDVPGDSVIAFPRVRLPPSVRALARRQGPDFIGSVVWGISQALHEETHSDHRLGRFMNHNLSEYHVAVNADIHDIDVVFVEEDDRIVSRLGAKGVGEIGIVGVSAAVSNAIYHAIGRRLRSTPMTPDKVMLP